MDSPTVTTNLSIAVANVRSRGIVVVKTARNTGLNCDYASYADVWEVLKDALAEQAISVGFLPSTIRKESDAWVQNLIMVVTREGDTQQVPFEILFPEGNRGVNLTQRQGMAHTYGKRYALIDYFHLITGDDDDAQRLGQPLRENTAPTPEKSAHWSEFCHVPAFNLGSEETAGTWGPMADPSDETGERTLGDNAPGVLAKLGNRYPNHPGITAWRAELVGSRAEAKDLADWDLLRTKHRSLNLPANFADCTGDELTNLALALR